MIPDSNAISDVNNNTCQPDRTELNTVFAEVPGGSSTTMNATPGDPSSDQLFSHYLVDTGFDCLCCQRVVNVRGENVQQYEQERNAGQVLR